MSDTIEQVLVAPRYLAGGGDPRWVTVPLHQACGWHSTHTPLSPRVHLTSPNQQAELRLEPDPDQPWWTVRHAPNGSQPPWWARFDARTPVEIIAALTDTLTTPDLTAIRASDPYEPLRKADWHQIDNGLFTSADGLVHVDHFTHAGSNSWFITTALSEDPENLIWQAHLDGNTPPHLITALTQALANPVPLRRDPLPLPAQVRRHIDTTRITVSTKAAASALNRRVRHVASRKHPTPPPAQPPQRAPRSHR
ncbi:hypothetical protein T261_0848 [Streptomyces lydicus]|nr:hypothetical protein T261_0848 [Streptomyces lydicus]